MSALKLDHVRVKRLRRLVGRRSSRLEERAFVAEGAKTVAEALRAGAPVEALYVADGTVDPVIDAALARGVRVYDLSPGVLERVADTTTPQPIMAVIAMVDLRLEMLSEPLAIGGFVIVGVDLRDPGNAGTVIRSAEAAGAAGVVLCEGSVEATNPKTVRASAGSLFHVPVIAGGAPQDVLGWLGSRGVRRWATSSHAADAVRYDDADLRGPCAIVIGNEAHGLPANTVDHVDGFVTIPMRGRSESLNVGMATAVLCFEASRQRSRSASPTPVAFGT